MSDGDDGGTMSEEAFRGLADGTFVFSTLSMALETLGMDERAAETAAEELRERRRRCEGLTVRGDIVDGRRGRWPVAGSEDLGPLSEVGDERRLDLAGVVPLSGTAVGADLIGGFLLGHNRNHRVGLVAGHLVWPQNAQYLKS